MPRTCRRLFVGLIATVRQRRRLHTVEFGVIVPRGPIRLLTGTEALTGLLLIA